VLIDESVLVGVDVSVDVDVLVAVAVFVRAVAVGEGSMESTKQSGSLHALILLLLSAFTRQ
jgi:hypothetical protein